MGRKKRTIESLAKELGIELLEPKLFIVANIRELEKQVALGEISYSRMVEIMNEMAYNFYNQKNNNMKKAEKLLVEMGFKKVTSNQFSHPHFGYIHLDKGTMKEVAEKIFELGQYKKCEELFGVLKISSFVR